jgi:hypothetical protein
VLGSIGKEDRELADGRATGNTARPRPRAAARRRKGASGSFGWLKGCLSALLLLVVVIGAACGMLYVRVQHGPVSIKPLATLIEREINGELTGLEARIEDAQIAYDETRGFELRLANLRLVEPNGDAAVSVPAAVVELSGPALRSFRLVPSRIDLIEPRLSVIYTDAGGWSLSFPQSAGKVDGRLGGQTPAPLAAPPAAQAQNPSAKPVERVDFAAMIAGASARARKRVDGTSYLREVGVKNATVTVDNRGALSEWRVLDGSIDLDHSKRESIAAGRARMASSRGPWSLAFQAVEAAPSGAVTIEVAIRDLHPRVIGLAFSQASALQPLDVPVSGQVQVTLGPGGVMSTASVSLEADRGVLVMPSLAEAPLPIDKATLRASYAQASRKLDIASATFAWGNSRVDFKGGAAGQPAANGAGLNWSFAIGADRGQLAAEEFGIAPLPLTAAAIEGRMDGKSGDVTIDKIQISAGGADFSGAGGMRPAGAAGPGGGFIEAKLGPTTVDRLKALWPRGIASGARTWVGEKIKKGTIKSGTLRFYSGVYARETGTTEPRRLSLALEATDVMGMPLAWLSPIEAPRLLVRLEDNTVEVNIPDAQVALGPNKRVPIKGGRFAASDLEKKAPIGEVTFRSQGALVPLLEVLDQSPLKLLRANAISTEGVDGKVEGQVKLSFPLISDLLAADVAIEAKAKVTEGRVKQLGGAYDVQAAAVAVDVTPAAVDAKGEMLINGVPVKIGWQRILDDSGDKQPPLRLSASLDNADRTQLGIDVNHIIQGEVPVEVLIEKGQGDAPSVKMRADLTNAEIGFESIAWRKPPGRAATLQADLLRGKTYKVELQNLRVAGDDIAMEGWAGIAGDNRLREIELKELTLNVVSKLEVQGSLKTDANDKVGIWNVKVKGRTFDGRDLFRSLFAVGAAPDKAAKPGKPSTGMDLEADIDNVLGQNDVGIRGFKLRLSRRNDRLVSIDGRGTLDGGAPIAIAMVPPAAGEQRVLRADTSDAGNAFRLIGFYPNMQSGRLRLEVNVDGRGPAEKTGTLWVDDFRVLGDPIVSEVLAQPSDEPQAGKPVARKTGVQRETFEFDRMKVPFSVGYGQFVIENAYMRGPLQGVALTGKVDFKLKSLNLGGTYIPLHGLNNAFGEVPLFGELLSDGMFGLTFAVQGPIAQPQVLVNPFSVVAPGILRGLTQMTNPNPKVVPREERAPAPPVEKRVRSSSPTPVAPERSNEPARPKAGSQTGGGWTSQVAPEPSIAPVAPNPVPAKRPKKPAANPDPNAVSATPQ